MVSSDDTVIRVNMPSANSMSKDQLEYKKITRDVTSVNSGLDASDVECKVGSRILSGITKYQKHFQLLTPTPLYFFVNRKLEKNK